MGAKTRIARLEREVGKESRKYFIAISLPDGMTKAEGLEIALKQRGIGLRDLGLVFFTGYGCTGVETQSFGGFTTIRELQGFAEFMQEIHESPTNSIRRAIAERRKAQEAQAAGLNVES